MTEKARLPEVETAIAKIGAPLRPCRRKTPGCRHKMEAGGLATRRLWVIQDTHQWVILAIRLQDTLGTRHQCTLDIRQRTRVTQAMILPPLLTWRMHTLDIRQRQAGTHPRQVTHRHPDQVVTRRHQLLRRQVVEANRPRLARRLLERHLLVVTPQ